MSVTRKSQKFDAIPPTRDVLLQHVKSTANQAGCTSGVQRWNLITSSKSSAAGLDIGRVVEAIVDDNSRGHEGLPRTCQVRVYKGV